MSKINKFFKISLILTLILPIFNFGVLDASAKNYSEGALLSPASKGGNAVYYIGADGKKYIFPEGKTYDTWYDNFDQVKQIPVSELDQYPDGGVMPIKGGTKLITHRYTAMVYAVEPGGVIRHVPTEVKARELFGDDWHTRVVDVLPGFFATTYQAGSEVSDTLPNSYVVTDDNGKYYYIENGKKRLLSSNALSLNNFKTKHALRIKNLNRYQNSESIAKKKKALANFVPPLEDADGKKVTICHIPRGNPNNQKTISVSKNSLKAHLKNGSTIGACQSDQSEPGTSPPPVEVEPGQWCSVLMGIFSSDTLGYGSTNPHSIMDLNNDGVVNLSDNGLMVDAYSNGDDGTCYDYIYGSYTADDYQNIDWCNSLVQGVSDNIGDTSPFDPFDINEDSVINLSDVSMVASYLYQGDQNDCYGQYHAYLPDMDGVIDYDIDNDGYDAIAHGGLDCNDDDADINPAAEEICGNDIDENCNGEVLQCDIPDDPGDISIDYVSNDANFIHGQPFFVNVSGVENVENISPLLWDNVEDSYDTIQDTSLVPVDSDVDAGHPWRLNNHDVMHFATADSRDQRGVSTAHYINDTSINNHSTFRGYDYNPDGLGYGNPEMYVSWHIRTNATTTGASTKLMRLWAGDHNGRTYRLSWTTMHLSYNYSEDAGVEGDRWASINHEVLANGTPGRWNHWNGEADLNQWHRNEFYFKQSSSHDVDDGKIYITTDGKVEHDHDLATWLAPWDSVEGAVHPGIRGGNDPINNVWIFGLDPSVSVGDYIMELDDIYINNTKARVEICDVTYFGNRDQANCEVQPATSWQNGHIMFTANQGDFTANDNTYLFVIDEEGNYTSGYPVQF